MFADLVHTANSDEKERNKNIMSFISIPVQDNAQKSNNGVRKRPVWRRDRQTLSFDDALILS